MRIIGLIAMFAIMTGTMVACQTVTKQQMGVGTGVIIGGLLGSQIGKGGGQKWAIGAGALLGALAGSEIGRQLDEADKMYMNRSYSEAHTVPMGETVSWNNPDSGHSGSIKPVRDGYTKETNRYCREYEQTIYIDGRQEIATGQACQQSDGRWEIIN